MGVFTEFEAMTGIHPLAQDTYGLSDEIALFFWVFFNTAFPRVTGIRALLVLTMWHTCNTVKVTKVASVTSVQTCQAASLQQGVCCHHPPALPPRLRSPKTSNRFSPGFPTSKLQLSLRSVHPEPVSLPSLWPLVGLCYLLASPSAMSSIICLLKICFMGL